LNLSPIQADWRTKLCRLSVNCEPEKKGRENLVGNSSGHGIVATIVHDKYSPLVKSIRRNEATFGKDRISKCRCGCHGLRPSVERPIPDAHVFCPGWNQSPTHGCEVANLFALFFEDNQDWLRWRNVVSRMLFNFIIRRLKPFSKVLLRVRQSVSVTHTFILTAPHQFPSNFRPIQGQDKQR